MWRYGGGGENTCKNYDGQRLGGGFWTMGGDASTGGVTINKVYYNSREKAGIMAV